MGQPQTKESSITNAVAEAMNDGMLTELECPVCLEPMMPPIILICNNGHSLCDGCASNTQICPTCGTTAVKIRNLALENMTRKLQYHCKYSGCNETFPLHLITDHQAVCPHGPQDCPFTSSFRVNCNWNGPRDSIKDHLTDKHEQNVITATDGKTVDIYTELNRSEEGISLEKIVTTNNELFYLTAGVEAGNFYIILRHVENKKSFAKFKYECIMANASKNQSIAIYNVACSMNECVDDVRKSGKCVLIPLNVLENYTEDEDASKLHVCINITQIAE
jgi:hypothetical protein